MTSTPARQIKASVVRKEGGPFQVETLALEEPRPGLTPKAAERVRFGWLGFLAG